MTKRASRPAAKRKTKAARIAQNSESRRGKNPNSLAAIAPHKFPPGVSGNPGGRPKSLTDAYRKMLAEVDPGSGMTKAELLAQARYIEALSSDHGTSAAREIRQATEGDRLTIDVRQRAVDAILRGDLTRDACAAEFGPSLTEEWFADATARRGLTLVNQDENVNSNSQ